MEKVEPTWTNYWEMKWRRRLLKKMTILVWKKIWYFLWQKMEPIFIILKLRIISQSNYMLLNERNGQLTRGQTIKSDLKKMTLFINLLTFIKRKFCRSTADSKSIVIFHFGKLSEYFNFKKLLKKLILNKSYWLQQKFRRIR